jgi:hypothetical protein
MKTVELNGRELVLKGSDRLDAGNRSQITLPLRA